MSKDDDRQALKNAIYRNPEILDRVTREIRKRHDMAVNGVMSIVADLYADGVADGDSFGMRSVAADIRATAAREV